MLILCMHLIVLFYRWLNTANLKSGGKLIKVLRHADHIVLTSGSRRMNSNPLTPLLNRWLSTAISKGGGKLIKRDAF